MYTHICKSKIKEKEARSLRGVRKWEDMGGVGNDIHCNNKNIGAHRKWGPWKVISKRFN